MKHLKIIISMMSTMLQIISIQAQVLNGGFESNGANGQHCPAASGDISQSPFNKQLVDNWKSSHGSAQLHRVSTSDQSCATSLNDASSGSYCTFLSYSTVNCEGIFQELSFEENEVLNLKISIKGILSNSKVVIKLKNGLTNDNMGAAFPSSSLASLINPAEEQLLLEQIVSTDWTTYYVTNITARKAFSQLWIYAENNSIKIDDMAITLSCCKLREEYQNISNPPSTYRNDYIKAGENIDNTRTAGKVIIDNNVPTIFQAKNEIVLESGFEVVNNSDFIAQIDICTNLTTSIEVEKMLNRCEHYYLARICNGSGFYTYDWQLDGMEALGGTNSYRVGFKPISGKTVTLTITDLATNSQTVKIIPLGYVPFTGGFPNDSFITSNVFTPNGDGFNDVWFVGDAHKPNALKYAYDAYEISLDIVNRWNQQVISQHLSQQYLSGFANKWVSWDGAGQTSANSPFAVVSMFKNCYNTKWITQSLTMITQSVTEEKGEDDNIDKLENHNAYEHVHEPKIKAFDSTGDIKFISIYPNPSGKFVTIIICDNLSDKPTIQIYDLQGRVMFESTMDIIDGSGSKNINTSNFSNGLYFVTVSNGKQKVTKKLMVQHE